MDITNSNYFLAAGLLVGNQTLLSEENANNMSQLCEDRKANSLVWILSKIVNFLAVGDSVDSIFPQDPSSPTSMIGVNQLTLLRTWEQLEDELNKWSQDLPPTFSPYARISPTEISSANFTEIWFSIPMCASTMQSYHMARIMLSMNKPQESTARRTTLGARLQSYRLIESEVRYHSREICGIALGSSDSPSRAHMIQPLFIAGQCLQEPDERRIVLRLLQSIETDLGWAVTRYVDQLLHQWE
jgi:Fungal specific transcription factor domain